jgi:low temperature requirement protein LtrA
MRIAVSREPGAAREVSPLELFFDLVYVFAIEADRALLHEVGERHAGTSVRAGDGAHELSPAQGVQQA